MKKLFLILATAGLLAFNACNPVTPEKPEEKKEEKKEDPPKKEEPVVEEGTVRQHDFIMGSLLGFEKGTRNGNSSKSKGSASTTYFNRPLFEMAAYDTDDFDWWADIIEEYEYAGLDYLLLNCRGRQPKAGIKNGYDVDHGDPTKIPDMIAAMEDRGVTDLKIAIFDDAPASWAAARNMDLYGKYTSVVGNTAADAYPIDNLDEIYKYIWDYNIKMAFENFYGENQKNNKYLLRIDGKPLLVIWSPNGFVNVDYAGKKPDCTKRFKAIFDKLHEDFKATFGEEVHICVDRAFSDRDSYVTKEVVESMNRWFSTNSTSATYGNSVHTMNNFTVGVAVPGFVVNNLQGNLMFIDSDHGNTLKKHLELMITNKANLVILEGFSDQLENAAYWRSSDTKYYDYPNQRLNILRKYSSTKAYPKEMKVEAEACDFFKDKSSGNSGKQYREGDIDIMRCNDGYKGWCVTNTEAGEYLEWVELPYSDGKTVVKLRYSSTADAVVRFDINTTLGTEVKLPSTNGDWKDIDAAEVTFDKKGWRKTVLNIISGNPDINYFVLKTIE